MSQDVGVNNHDFSSTFHTRGQTFTDMGVCFFQSGFVSSLLAFKLERIYPYSAVSVLYQIKLLFSRSRSNHLKTPKLRIAHRYEEMNAYFGLMVLMSINPIPDIKLYWSTDEFYRNPVISEVVPFKRFQKITENFHVDNILEETQRQDNLS